jgi:nitric oxide reductase subunit C
MSNTPRWASEDFWRKIAVWVTAGMFVVLIILTLDTTASIEPGSSRVPAYSVINHRIYYRFDQDRDKQIPVIGDEAPLFGERLSDEDAEALVNKGT